MWKGAIQFGLVTIPVKLYLATESRAGVSFNMLHEKDMSRIQMKIWCPRGRGDHPRTETVKGYEYAPGKYVVINDEDLEKLPLKTVRSIEIEQFVDATGGETNTKFVKQAYYLEPDRVGRKAFELLKEVLAGQGPHRDLQDRDPRPRGARRARPVREHDAALDPVLAGRDPRPRRARPARGGVEIKPAEKKMAAQLIEAMTGEFDPAEYRDEYREALMQVIESKIEGRETVSEIEPAGRGCRAPRDHAESQEQVLAACADNCRVTSLEASCAPPPQTISGFPRGLPSSLGSGFAAHPSSTGGFAQRQRAPSAAGSPRPQTSIAHSSAAGPRPVDAIARMASAHADRLPAAADARGYDRPAAR